MVITGVASHWGTELARRLERDPSIEYIAGIDSRPPDVELERTDFIEADLRSPLLARLLPGTEADTVVHCGIVWYPEPGKPARALHDINVIGTPAAARRLRADRHPGADRRPGIGRDLRLRGRGAVVLHRGPRAPAPASDPVPARRLRARGLLRELRPTPPARLLLHAALPAGDRPRPRHAAGPLPDPARSCRSSSASTRGCSSSTPRTPPQPSRPRCAAACAAPSTSRPTGAVSLQRILRLARRPALPIPHPLFGPALGRLGKRARCRRALRRRRTAAPLRARGRQPAAARGGRLRAALRRRGRDPGLHREAAGRRIGPAAPSGAIAGTARRGGR